MRVWTAKIKGDKWLYEITDLPPWQWTTLPPYATEQDVFVRHPDGEIEFGWVDADIRETESGIEITGLSGGTFAKPVTHWMPCQLFTEDAAGWHSEFTDGLEPVPGDRCAVTVETVRYGIKHYSMETDTYKPDKKGEWVRHPYNRGGAVIAWRPWPKWSETGRYT